ncbi:MAG TPA: ABC transporter substrate-binding protein [Candidatus Ventrousia excrementavium]|uniref:ABC transporter substrate-binding protein n=1 Tax=Candidatus Ventrousia excrementavium TaxID=2840961 RepID=A0A9D1LLJ8_9CLOT|nr:ABC transporter substrate-binding protein [Candidatus Ventrousia excrementavium]
MKKKLSLLLALCLLAVPLTACQSNDPGTSQSDSDTAQSDSDTLVIATAFDIASLDPGHIASSAELNVGSYIYDTLTWLPLGAEESLMRIAESCTVSDDGLTYTFTLRDDVLFHDGSALTADDVLYSIELFRSSASLASFSYSIAGCEAPDDNTVVVTLSAPDPAFFENLNWCFILPKAAHEAAGGNFGTQPVGSGPYQLVSHTPGDRLVLSAFPDYYRGEASIKNCQVKIIPDAFTIATALETGEVHYSIDVSFDHIETLKQSGKVACEIREGTGSIFAYGIHQNPPYDNVLVRKAISYAIDRQMCSDVACAGYAYLNPTPLPSFAFDGLQDVESYSYDPEKARELLAEAGYPGGEGLRPLTIQTIDSIGSYAEVIQANLADIGITSEIETLETNAFISDAAVGNVDLAIMSAGLGGNAAPYIAMFTTDGQMNFPRYSNARVDELYAEAVAEPDSTRRQELYNEIFNIIIDEDAVVSPILGRSMCHAVSNEVEIGNALDNAYLMLNPYDLSFQ